MVSTIKLQVCRPLQELFAEDGPHPVHRNRSTDPSLLLATYAVRLIRHTFSLRPRRDKILLFRRRHECSANHL
jgi:hypothetical protein